MNMYNREKCKDKFTKPTSYGKNGFRTAFTYNIAASLTLENENKMMITKLVSLSYKI